MNPNYSSRFSVEQSPAEVFAAINNVRAWWSEDVEGSTDKQGEEFRYHYKDVHRSVMQVTELVLNKKVVWFVLDNYFNFIQDQSEWKGTRLIFEIAEKDGKTELHFTHQGLVPDYECFEICSNAWGFYINTSLRELITTGKGQPNSKETANTADEARLSAKNQDYYRSFVVEQSPAEVFAAINDVRGWWGKDVEGITDKLGESFLFEVPGVHRSVQKITELVPNEKVVWRILEAQLDFAQNKREWEGTDVIFEVVEVGGNTELRFTHLGLVPDFECFENCSNGWNFFLDSLRQLITTGTGQPFQKGNEDKEKAKLKPLSVK